MTSIRTIATCTFGIALLWATATSAQSELQGASGAAAAEGLYEQAKLQLKAGENAKACALLEESQRLERAVGTVLLLAHCYESVGRTASAWALFREVESVALDSQRQRIARIRASVLEPTLATLVIEVSRSERPNQNTLSIHRDSVDVSTKSLGVAVPVDPGRHTITVSRAHAEPWSSTVEASAGTLTRVVIPSLRPKRLALESAAPVRSPAAGANSLTVAFDREPRSSNTLPWVLTGLGGASLLAGITLAITAHDQYAQSDAHCRTRSLCDTIGLQFRADARTQAAWATGLSVVGAAALASAGLLFVFDTNSDTALYVQPAATARTLSVLVGGTL